MWCFFKTGFYSAVVDAGDSEVVVVRARSRRDLEALKVHFLTEASEIHDTPERDYGFRVFTTRAAWASALARAALDLDYSNYKAMVDQTQGRDRERLYAQIWGLLLRGLQSPRNFARTAAASLIK